MARSTRRLSPKCASTPATCSSVWGRPTSCGASKTCLPQSVMLATDPVRELAAALGPEVVLDRPADAAHGDYATNAALKLAGALRRPPREIASELAEDAARLPGVERTE